MSVTANTGAFDIGINDRLPFEQALILGLRHVFGMTGMFVFPGLLGRSFNLPAERIAYLYGMTWLEAGETRSCPQSECLREFSQSLVAKLIVQQPVISGGLTLVILHSLLCPAASAPETVQA